MVRPLLSLTVVLSVITFFLQIAHPLVNPQAAGTVPDLRSLIFALQAIGVIAVVVQTAVLMALILLAARRFVLPFGALTMILGLNALALCFEGRVAVWTAVLRFVPAALVAGLLADTLYAALRASSTRATASWGSGCSPPGVPMLVYLLYFLTLLATSGIWWSIHLVARRRGRRRGSRAGCRPTWPAPRHPGSRRSHPARLAVGTSGAWRGQFTFRPEWRART